MLMELYICCHGTESVHRGFGFQTVLFSKLYIYNCCKCIVLDPCAYCTIVPY